MTNEVENEPPERKEKSRLTRWITISLLLGLFCGLFFGEAVGSFRILGDVYIGLLQMTVLPFIVFSLIGNVGRLTLAQGRLLAGIGVGILLLLWGIGCVTIMIMSIAFPVWETGAFFSSSLIEPAKEVALLDLYIPSNPFKSLSWNYVPAVVLFCLLFGSALILVEGKEPLLDLCDVISTGLRRLNGFIVKLTPIGIFGITASAAGTMTMEEFGRLQAYFLTYGSSVLILSVVALPMIAASLTPFSYLQIVRASRDAAITAFVTGSTFVVIPLLVDSVQKLFSEIRPVDEKEEWNAEFIIPLGYPFPHLGTVLAMLFVTFAAWFYGQSIPLTEYPDLLVRGIFLVFGKLVIAIPALLDYKQIPADIFQLFLASGVIAGRLGDLAGSVHLMIFTILTMSWAAGTIRFRPHHLARVAIVGVLLTVGAAAGIRALMNAKFKGSFARHDMLLQMQLMDHAVPFQILAEAAPNPVPLREGQGRMDRIKERGLVRVGFAPDRLPFSFFNAKDDLVGFDVDLIEKLAEELDVGIEFVPYRQAGLAEQLRADHFDIAISGVIGTSSKSAEMLFSKSYLTVNAALVVRDYRRKQFSSEASVLAAGPIRIGTLADTYIQKRIHQRFPNAEAVALESEREFFEDESLNLDALATSAQGGSAWTLCHPGYVTVNPLERMAAVPVVMPLAGEDFVLEEYLENWIQLKQLDGTIEQIFDYWILGKSEKDRAPRWCIAKDVLGWGDPSAK
jgi:Na+/H+-dicarboxylate symporter/ABC-type amino acid transport substrate-binding protein